MILLLKGLFHKAINDDVMTSIRICGRIRINFDSSC